MRSKRRTGEPWSRAEERPLTARSVLASTLLGTRPPQMPSRYLVRACGLFGISDGTTRVAISRMVAAGELVAVDGVYGLAGPLLERAGRQDESAAARTTAWSEGDPWVIAAVVAEGRSAADRGALRAAMAELRRAELREGLWLRPDNLPVATSPAATVVDDQCLTIEGHPDTDQSELVAQLWPVAAWSARADRLLVALDRTAPGLERRDPSGLADGFVLSAAVLRHMQADPLLPAVLLPSGWPGFELRSRHIEWRIDFEATWRTWVVGSA